MNRYKLVRNDDKKVAIVNTITGQRVSNWWNQIDFYHNMPNYYIVH